MSEQQCWHRDPSACKCKEVYLKAQLAAANEAKENVEALLSSERKKYEDLASGYEITDSQLRAMRQSHAAVVEAAEQKTAELAAIIERKDEAMKALVFEQDDGEVFIECTPRLANNLLAALALKSPAAQVLAERDAGIWKTIAKIVCCHCEISLPVREEDGDLRHNGFLCHAQELWDSDECPAAALSSKSAIGPEEGGKR